MAKNIAVGICIGMACLGGASALGQTSSDERVPIATPSSQLQPQLSDQTPGVNPRTLKAAPGKVLVSRPRIDDDPFAFAIGLAKGKTGTASAQKQRSALTSASRGGKGRHLVDSQTAKTALSKMRLAYGPAKSVRGNIHIWELPNPQSGPSDDKTVTVMITDGASGGEIVADRFKGRDGRATWANRKTKAQIRAERAAKGPKKPAIHRTESFQAGSGRSD